MIKGKYRVVIDARMINHSGIGTYIKSIIPNLAGQFDLILLGPNKILKTQPWGDKVNIVDMNSPIYTIMEQLELYFKIPKCDLFLSPHYNIPLLPIKANKRVVIVHDVNHLVFIDQLSIIKRMYAKLMITAAVNRSDSIITISEFSKEEIIKYTGVKRDTISIVNYGMDKWKFQEQISYGQFETLRRRYDLPDNYLLYVGSIKAHKNFAGLVKVFAYILKSFPEKKLVVVGIKFDELINEKGIFNTLKNNKLKDNIIFTGYIEENDLALIYNNATCLIFPSMYEGFGIPPLEAMASNCPVIASNLASIPEVCGEAAIYFNPDDIQDMTNKIIALISNDNSRNDLIEKGKKNLDRFTPERFSIEITSVLLDTINDFDDEDSNNT